MPDSRGRTLTLIRILKQSYIEASLREGRFVDEAAHEWNSSELSEDERQNGSGT